MSTPTAIPDLNQVLAELFAGVQAILGDNFVGAYLQGSFAVGDADNTSDVDFIVVVEADFDTAVMAALQALHRRVYRLPSRWAQHLEGSYFPRAMLRDPAQTGRDVWYLDHGSINFERSDHCNTLVVRWSLQEYGITLAGPPPQSLIEPITADMLRREVWQTMQDWGAEIMEKPGRYANGFYQGYLVLSYCRMLQTLHNGRVTSKPVAAEWGRANLAPEWVPVIDRAWSDRPEANVHAPADPDYYALARQFVRYAIDEGRIVMTA